MQQFALSLQLNKSEKRKRKTISIFLDNWIVNTSRAHFVSSPQRVGKFLIYLKKKISIEYTMTLDVQNVFQWTNVWHQYFASFTGNSNYHIFSENKPSKFSRFFLANLISLSQGMVIGWLSPAIPLLASNSTPLSTGPLTNEEISWIGSLGSVGGLLGCISLGFITTRIGSRNAVMLLAWPSIAYFLLIRFGDTYYYLMVARFVSGWAGAGMYGTITLYISEIANDKWVEAIIADYDLKSQIFRSQYTWQSRWYSDVLSEFRHIDGIHIGGTSWLLYNYIHFDYGASCFCLFIHDVAEHATALSP